MPQSLGQLGKVVTFNAKGDVVVTVDGRRWILNPKCIMPAPGETPLETEEGGRAWGGGDPLCLREGGNLRD